MRKIKIIGLSVFIKYLNKIEFGEFEFEYL